MTPSQGHQGSVPVGCTTIVDVLRWRAANEPDRIAYTFLMDGDENSDKITYGALYSSAQTICSSLSEVSQFGDRAMLLYPPGLEFIRAFFGCLLGGVVAIPAYPPRRRHHLQRLTSILDDAKPTLVLMNRSDSRLFERSAIAQEAFSRVHQLKTDCLENASQSSTHHTVVTDETLALLQYTSGSTSSPKGVMVRHRHLAYNSRYIQTSFGLSRDSVSVSWLPMFHDMGLIEGVIQPLFSGFHGVLMPAVSFIQKPLRWLNAIHRFRGTHGGAPNFAFDLCVDKIPPSEGGHLDLSCVDSLYNAAEPIRRSTMQRFGQRFADAGLAPEALHSSYGLAEATLMVSGARAPRYIRASADALEKGMMVDTDNDSRCVTLVDCGRTLLETEVRIVDPTSHVPCPQGSIGELWIGGPTVCDGYWNNLPETERTFRARISDSDGVYLRTGDLGCIRESGLFIAGRLKELMIIQGRNFFPQEIEAVAQLAHSALRNDFGAAFSVDIDGRESIILAQEVERSSCSRLDYEAILRSVMNAIVQAHDVTLGGLVLLKPATLPKTSSGKIQRAECRRRFIYRELQPLAIWNADLRRQGAISEGTWEIFQPSSDMHDGTFERPG